MKEKQQLNSNRVLLQYMSLGIQLIIALCVTVFVGLKADEWLQLPFPVLVWILPLMVIIALMIKLIKDTSKK